MSKELLSHERIKTYTTVWMDSLRGGETQLVNTNKLVRFYSGTTGLKTGTTNKAGYCLSASAERDGLHLIAVVMGAENSTDRFEGAKAMLDWGFANFETVTPQIDSSLFTQVEVLRGVKESIRPVITGVKPIILKAGEKSQLKTEINLCESVEAPVENNQILGSVILKIADKEIAKYNLINENFVEKTNIGHIMVRILRSLAKSA
jgi:D-alanyl-D-alanine carboxypeptidase (penicillin-binding protein 5/6)